MSLLLKEKTAFVSGGTRGIGAAICEIFAREGADVAFNYHTSDDLAKEIKTYPARLYLTYIYSKNVIKSINQPQLNLDKLQFHYNLTSKSGAEKIEQLRYKEREEIRNWVFTTQYLSRYNS